MDRTMTIWGAGSLMIAVGLGAFGAHGLKSYVTPDALGQWKTGVEYQFYHGLGLLLLARLGTELSPRMVRLAGSLFVAGIICFSGSLYLLSTRVPMGTEGLTPFLGPITPLGGLCFLSGWAVLLAAAVGQGRRN
ncbi:MAG: DUF423 domain-containing protein [Flavobacteriales bacterium]|nr:DUF423 domain-containing protein [Flavobacteriales bacterium]MBK6752771.1 DUF423 domain-containing protein [Flavobacteriales bacterium]MBK7085165.1 DUF423 domain-containing protein [Flavobacteriales bacterium]MBK7270220.1 DUF423 domain-containing protein [Flavobacteriales bacterium]MBK7754077.1 DUF423 domain-containing protein [Flavobacteriales bacterium]